MIIYINGFTASGKSTIGSQLAEELHLAFIDLDLYIEAVEGKTIAQLFSEQGEAAFRLIELKSLERIIKTHKEDTIVALGGGTACSIEGLNTVLRSGVTIHLKRTLDYYLNDVFPELCQRPLFKGLSDDKAKHKISSLWYKRQAFYSKSQLETLVTSGFSPKKLANTLKLLTNRPQSL